jgi:hypothetical protein
MTTFHGQLYLRDEVPPRSKYHDSGRFGRLFPTLPPFARDTEKVRRALLELGKPGGIIDPGTVADANPDNPEITAGFTFLGQFLDHDLTFDPTSSLERQNDPEAITNFRTPAFELDTVYGSGRGASPHLYDRAQPGKLLIDADFQRDLPRNSQNGALTGDPRNDENVIISQLHLAFIKFHNAVFDKVMAEGIADPNLAFEEAQRLVRWHYQWIVLYQFLPLTVGEDLVKDILKNGRKIYNWQNEPFIPVEFSVAAYRFGHSQIRPFYRVNGDFAAPIFDNTLNPDEPDPQDLRGGKRADRRFVEWDRFFQLSGTVPQPSKLIDTKLSPPLFTLPLSTIASNMPGNPISLAQRNLLRALVFSLPSGQRVARALKIRPLTVDALAPLNLDKSTPLWFYILHESSLQPVEGKMLGPVGGRIVAEVFIGLLEGDSMSFLRQDPDWTPTLPSEKKGDFRITDLLKFAGVA